MTSTRLQDGVTQASAANLIHNAQFVEAHEEDGTHKDEVISESMLTTAVQVKLNALDFEHNLTAVVPPTINDDSDDGYEIGSMWMDTVLDEVYRCVDATVGAAVWLNTTLTLDELSNSATITASSTATANEIVLRDGSGNIFAQDVNAAGDIIIASGQTLQTDGGQVILKGVDGSNINALYTGTTSLVINNQADSATLLTLLNGGNVGIGTNTPSRQLDIQNTSANTFLSLVTNPTLDVGILFGDSDSDASGQISYQNNGDNMSFYTAGSNRMVIDGSGNVGIGTSTMVSGSLLTLDGDMALGSTSNALSEIRFFDSSQSGTTRVRSNSDGLVFLTGNANRMVIDSSGNVGIGTSDTTTHLDGTTGLTIYHSTSPGLALANASKGALFYMSGTDLILYDSTANASRAVMDTSGNFNIYNKLRIGTGTPSYDFEISKSNDSNPVGSIQNTHATGYSGFEFYDSGSTADLYFGLERNDANGTRLNYINGDFTVYANGTQTATFDSSGNVGIGETNPSYALHVTRSGTNSVINVEDTAANAYFRIDSVGNIGYLEMTTTGLLNINNNSNNAMTINTNGDVGFGREVADDTIHTNVGIGTYAALHEYAPTLDFRVSNNLYYNSTGFFRITGSTASQMQVANGGFSFFTAASGLADSAATLNSAMVITNTGEVDISQVGGPTTPKLYFGGDTNTGISGDGGDQIFFTINGTERMRFSNAGGVFVYPAEDLNISTNVDSTSDVYIQNISTGTNASAGIQLIPDGNNLFIQSYNDNHASRADENWMGSTATGSDLVFATENTEALRIDSNQGVNIGQPLAGQALSVKAYSNAEIAKFYDTADNQIFYLQADGSGNGQMTLYRGLGANVAFQVATSGYVGIGAANSTNSLLDITGDSASVGVAVALNDTNASGRTYSIRSDAGTFYLRDIDAAADRLEVDSTGAIRHETAFDDLTAGAPGMLSSYSTDAYAIDKGGNHVFGGVYTSGGDITEFGGIGAYKENGTDANYAGYLAFFTRANGSFMEEAMRIDSSGAVAIGTTATPNLLTLQKPSTSEDGLVLRNSSGNTRAYLLNNSSDDSILSLINSSGQNAVILRANGTSYTFGGAFVVGASSASASAALAVESTTQGFLPPRMNTTQRNAISSPATGLTIFNTTTTKLETYDGSTWQAAW